MHRLNPQIRKADHLRNGPAGVQRSSGRSPSTSPASRSISRSGPRDASDPQSRRHLVHLGEAAGPQRPDRPARRGPRGGPRTSSHGRSPRRAVRDRPPRSARRPAARRRPGSEPNAMLSPSASGPRTSPGSAPNSRDDRLRPEPDHHVEAALSTTGSSTAARAPAARAAASATRSSIGWRPRGTKAATGLPAEEDLDDVAVLDPVRLALRAEPAGLARVGHRAERQQVLVGDGLGPDEALGEIRVDRAGGVDGGRAVADRPGPDLVGAGGQERDQAEQPVATGR